MSEPGPQCVACRRPSDQPICHQCRSSTRQHLYGIPALLVKLNHHLAAHNSGGGPIGRATFGSRPTANTQALTMLAGPLNGDYDTAPPGREVTAIPAWVTAWASAWRGRNGHHQPITRRIAVRWDTTALRHPPKGDQSDGLAHAWDTRFGRPTGSLALRTDLTYLTTWLDAACDAFSDTADFIDQLRTLTGVGLATVGEPSAAVYLGRCPEPILDRCRVQAVDAQGQPRWCGAKIYHQPDEGPTVMCPRCRTKTGERMWFTLALRMRDVWGVVGEREAWGR